MTTLEFFKNKQWEFHPNWPLDNYRWYVWMDEYLTGKPTELLEFLQNMQIRMQNDHYLSENQLTNLKQDMEMILEKHKPT